jgi:transposase
MGFSFWPKHEYACPCVDHCPHAAGASIGSLIFHANQNMEIYQQQLGQLDTFREEIDRQHREIQALRDEVKRLKAELKEERHKKFRKSADNAKLHDQDETNQVKQKTQAKRGARVGHPGWWRRITRKPDRVVAVAAPTACPDCGHAVKLYPKRRPSRHHQDDIIEGRKQTTCFVHPKARCTNPKCRRWAQKAGPGELLNSKIGPKARAMAVYLRVRIGVSVDNVVDILRTFAGLHLSAAAIVGFEKQAAEKAEPLARDVGKKLRACPVVHADESHWSVDAARWYGWFHGNADLAHFMLEPTRKGQVSRDLLGDGYEGTLVTDCYSGYEQHVAKHRQKCLAHVRRTALEWTPLAEDDPQAQRFFKRVIRWANRGMAYDRGKPKLKPKQERRWLHEELNKLEKLALRHEKAQQLQKRLIKHHDDWLTFLSIRQVPATNNLAERALRPLVIIRKISFGNRSESKARGLGDLMTVTMTAMRQGRHVLDTLVALVSGTTDQALKAMYAHPSAPPP